MINTKKLINELNNIKIDLKILELIEEQYKYQQMQFQKKTIRKDCGLRNTNRTCHFDRYKRRVVKH